MKRNFLVFSVSLLLGSLVVGADLWANGPFGSGSSISGLTTNTIPKATSATAIGDSSLSDDGTNIISTEAFLAPNGTSALPAYAFSGSPSTGLYKGTTASGVTNALIAGTGGSGYIQGAGILSTSVIGRHTGSVFNFGTADGTGFHLGSDIELSWSSSTEALSGTYDLRLARDAAANLQLGADSATPVSQILSAADGSGTDIAGGALTLAGGQGTGTGIGGDVATQTSPSGTTGAVANTLGDRSRVLAKYTTLTEATATAFARVAIASGTVVGGEVVVTVEANDGTDYQARTLRFGFSAVNKAGTTTTGIDTPSESVAVSTGTLTCTITAVDATANVDLKASCTSSLTQTVLRANAVVTVKNFGTGAISAQ